MGEAAPAQELEQQSLLLKHFSKVAPHEQKLSVRLLTQFNVVPVVQVTELFTPEQQAIPEITYEHPPTHDPLQT